MSEILIVEMVMALIMLISKHNDAGKISAEEIDAELARVREEFNKRHASDLPDV